MGVQQCALLQLVDVDVFERWCDGPHSVGVQQYISVGCSDHAERHTSDVSQVTLHHRSTRNTHSTDAQERGECDER